MISRYQEHLSDKKVSILLTWLILLFSISFFYAPLTCAEDPFFSIALSKFNSERDAAKEETKLKNAGHNAFYRKEKSPDNKSTLYQVYIEKYNTREEAEKEARVLNDLELISDYSVREVRETPLTVPGQNTPAEENNAETSPIPQSTEIEKQQPLNPSTETEDQTTPPELSPAVAKPEIARSEAINETESETDSSSEINKGKIETVTPSEINRPEPEAEIPPEANKTEQKPVMKPEQKAEPKKKITKPEVVNHVDARLTGASLQVGSFKDEANAAELKTELINLGKNALYRYESADSKGEFYRIYITGYSSLHEAIIDAKALKESGVIAGYSRIISKKSFPGGSSKKVSENEKEDKSFFLHISSNKDETNAEEAVARLKKAGYKAFYVYDKDPADSWYRVYIGEFKDEAEAREKGEELIKNGIITYFKPIIIDRKKLNN